MPHKRNPRYITPLEVETILDACYLAKPDCHLAHMQCIAKGINDLFRGRPDGIPPQLQSSRVILQPKIMPSKDMTEMVGKCPICSASVFKSPSGLVCTNGHGGIDPVTECQT